MKCTVIIPVGPGHQELALRAENSVLEAIASGTGPFHEVDILCKDDSEGKQGRSKTRNNAVAEAADAGADWVFFLDADDIMTAHAFTVIENHIDNYDALWGEIYEADYSTKIATRRPNQISPITSLNQILLNDPYLTLQMGHFATIKTALDICFDESMDCGEDVDYFLRTWKEKRCLKIEAPIFFNIRGQHSIGPRSATGKNWRESISTIYTKFCTENNVISSISFEEKTVHFKITNTLDLIQNTISRENFFEFQELLETSSILPINSKILDIGSNIGNHSLFFTICAEAREIHCFEPSESTADALKENFEINQVPPKAYTIHRLAIGAKTQQGKLCNFDTMNSGATSVKNDVDGKVRIDSLDNIFIENSDIDLLKIDVEGMELDVLSGGKKLINNSRPIILIEVSNSNKGFFFSWLTKNSYSVHRAFELVHASNYILTPNIPRKNFYKNQTAHQRVWKSKVPAPPGKPELGWSKQDFILSYISQDAFELTKNKENEYIIKNIKNNKLIKKMPVEAIPKSVIFLGEILEETTDIELNDLLERISLAGHEIIFLAIMDSRWNKSFSTNSKFRDSEHYIIEGIKHGYTLKKYLKAPHKAAFEISYQLDSRATMLHFAKSSTPE